MGQKSRTSAPPAELAGGLPIHPSDAPQSGEKKLLYSSAQVNPPSAKPAIFAGSFS
jgi:hypothetical protein